MLTNSGTRACALSGWPTVTRTHDDARVTIPTTNINQPRSRAGMVLRKKRSAFAALRWTTCAATASGCRSFTGLQIGAPGADQIQARLLGFPTKQLRTSAVQIGSIQPTTTDIISW